MKYRKKFITFAEDMRYQGKSKPVLFHPIRIIFTKKIIHLLTYAMKKVLNAIAAGMLTAGLMSCGGESKNENIITTKKESRTTAEPVRMQDYTQSKDVEWLGNVYTCEIKRTADDKLAQVKDESGQKFVDNSISLTVNRADGSTFFNKTFTKASFEQHISDEYSKSGILEGLVFDRVEGSSLLFAASVSLPQTDEYIPLIVKVSRMGDVTISRDTQLDTSSQEEDEI